MHLARSVYQNNAGFLDLVRVRDFCFLALSNIENTDTALFFLILAVAPLAVCIRQYMDVDSI